ncbi:MAG: hypothetical protein M4579_002177 [Chaenotheca gracillima]|nr:MAG: hypothetical protein M4579_002177 [Chaenotheca gracillima]
MRASPYVVLALSAMSSALPTVSFEKRDLSDSIRDYFTAVGKHIEDIRSQPKIQLPMTCNLDKLIMPVANPALPAPATGNKVVHVAIGRGVQNYTCADNKATTIPVSVGAVASLYNATCTGANYPDLLDKMPGVAALFPVPNVNQQLTPPNLLLSGHHYFGDGTTPIFDLDVVPQRSYGLFVGKKDSASPAPASAPKGDPPRGSKAGTKGYGSVAWLKLTTKDGTPFGTSKGIKEVYRLNTVGGNPPTTCSGQPKAFSVDYAAEYWFFN